eukprot:747884-Hanusia_phi.AAC.2
MSLEEYLQHFEDCKPTQRKEVEEKSGKISEGRGESNDKEETSKREQTSSGKVMYREVKKQETTEKVGGEGEENAKVMATAVIREPSPESQRNQQERWTSIKEHPFAISCAQLDTLPQEIESVE